MNEPQALYVSGPMRNVPGHNHAQFAEVASALRVRFPHATIYNPAENFDGRTDLDYHVYMTVDLGQVLMSDAIVFLPGWVNSEGAVEEARVGLATGKQFYDAVPVHGFTGWHFWPIPVEDVKACVLAFDPELAAEQRSEAAALTGIGPDVWIDEDESEPDDSPRVASLKRAIGYISGERNASYGPPTQDFKRTADLWTAFGFRFVQHDGAIPQAIEPHHIANAMILLKSSRLAWQPEKADSWDDVSGYAGCGHECVIAETDSDPDNEPLAEWERELLASDPMGVNRSPLAEFNADVTRVAEAIRQATKPHGPFTFGRMHNHD